MVGFRILEELVKVISVYLVALIVNEFDVPQNLAPSSLDEAYIIYLIVLTNY